jgi:hypothetical protein
MVEQMALSNLTLVYLINNFSKILQVRTAFLVLYSAVFFQRSTAAFSPEQASLSCQTISGSGTIPLLRTFLITLIHCVLWPIDFILIRSQLTSTSPRSSQNPPSSSPPTSPRGVPAHASPTSFAAPTASAAPAAAATSSSSLSSVPLIGRAIRSGRPEAPPPPLRYDRVQNLVLVFGEYH